MRVSVILAPEEHDDDLLPEFGHRVLFGNLEGSFRNLFPNVSKLFVVLLDSIFNHNVALLVGELPQGGKILPPILQDRGIIKGLVLKVEMNERKRVVSGVCLQPPGVITRDL